MTLSAISWLETSSNLGYYNADNALYRIYLAEKKYNEALTYLSQAAKRGSAFAIEELETHRMRANQIVEVA